MVFKVRGTARDRGAFANAAGSPTPAPKADAAPRSVDEQVR